MPLAIKSTRLPQARMARIVLDTRDGRRDKLIPLDDAKRLCIQGKLARLDMGPTYPNSYEYTRS